MNKQEIIKALSGKCDMTIVESQKVYDAFITIIKDGLKKDDRIKFFEFGTFSVQKRKASRQLPERFKSLKGSLADADKGDVEDVRLKYLLEKYK